MLAGHERAMWATRLLTEIAGCDLEGIAKEQKPSIQQESSSSLNCWWQFKGAFKNRISAYDSKGCKTF